MADQDGGGMNMMLAELFGTGGQAKTASAEDQEKLVQAELFSKLAADNGIDLDTLSDAQIKHLWHETFSDKTASAEPTPAADTEKKAQAEFEEKRAAAVKVAEAEYLGRVMAHAMVQELGKIGDAQTKTAGANGAPTLKDRLLKVAGELPPWLNKGKDGGGDDKGKEDKGDKGGPPEKKDEKKDEKKEASAIDAQAAKVAVDLVKKANLDVNVAQAKIAAVLTLGAKESTKIASAPDFATGLEIRALELLEQAGYPVNWGEAK
jgi:hypothetical protein